MRSVYRCTGFYERWPITVCHHPFLIGSSKYRLDIPQSQCIVPLHSPGCTALTTGKCLQSRLCKETVKESTCPVMQIVLTPVGDLINHKRYRWGSQDPTEKIMVFWHLPSANRERIKNSFSILMSYCQYKNSHHKYKEHSLNHYNMEPRAWS